MTEQASMFWSPAVPATWEARSCPSLLAKGYRVSVLDLFIYGHEVLEAVEDNPN